MAATPSEEAHDVTMREINLSAEIKKCWCQTMEGQNNRADRNQTEDAKGGCNTELFA